MFLLDDYDYKLPEELISHAPQKHRDQSRLLKLSRKAGEFSHHGFSDIVDFLRVDDILVINNTRVIPGRVYGKKESGGKIEILILDYIGGKKNLATEGFFQCKCLVKASKRPANGSFLYFNEHLKAEVIDFENGIYILKFLLTSENEDIDQILEDIGKMPLPPYIKREEGKSPVDDKKTYQTVYASKKGAIAAPTAGLHFTEELFKKIESKGVQVAEVTLHVGYGTFSPVRVNDIRDHEIHTEFFSISKESADIINRGRENGQRVICVGTTSVRTLEYASDKNGKVQAGSGSCDLFIYPGYEFKVVDGIVTNFHLPKSTLLMLISAFSGHNNVFKAYEEAVREKYRFFSYGDGMFID